jgi:RNA polymerase sigma factor (sigma-70 family)
VSDPTPVEDLLRNCAPQVLGALTRRHGQFDACEDAVQEALIDAARQWPRDGVPENPRGWLLTVASRRLVDEWRSESARRAREENAATDAGDDDTAPLDHDDTLALLFLCCHPELTAPSQIALTLRAVGGLSTEQIASAFLVPEATMAQRISRAKQRIRQTGGEFRMPGEAERDERLRAVLHVLYLIFNEGYNASSGPDLQRGELTAEAIRLTRMLRRLLPDQGEVTGLLALMLLTDARGAARTAPDGSLVPLADQDRDRWDHRAIAEGVTLISGALPHGPPGPYQLQAAIAAVHAETLNAQETDWRQILALYLLLEQIAPSPVVTLNRAVALAMVDGPRAGLELLATLDGDERLGDRHRIPAVRAHLLELAGDTAAAREQYREAARRTTSAPEQRYLDRRAAALIPQP